MGVDGAWLDGACAVGPSGCDCEVCANVAATDAINIVVNIRTLIATSMFIVDPVRADFTNTTGEKVFDGTLKQALAIQLEQSPYLKLLSDQKVRRR